MPRTVAAPKRQRAVVPNRAPTDLSNLRIFHNGFVFDTQRGTFHRVSDTAAFVLTELKAGRSLGDLVEDYARHYGVPLVVAERDVELFLNDMPEMALRDQTQTIGGPLTGGALVTSTPHTPQLVEATR